ncbi:MAG: xanthine dehydrogenase family protein molybdopterin-binding subunit, partial [Bacteroidetes bacterium]|nr:xanthine dehydrogenase family protein molybdopterin-binding subunit [Bacteroidota bacterium]
MPEVSAEIADLEEGAAVNYGFYSRNVMAREKALYQGHAIAGVAATTSEIAEEALSLIDVDYEVLTPVLDVLEAMKDDAPILHERLRQMTTPLFRVGGYGDGEKPTNISNRFEFVLGDVDAGF